MPRPIRLITLHCSASPNEATLFRGRFGTPGFRDPVMEIDLWHQVRGFHRDTYWRGRKNPQLQAIGYHFVIARNGALFTGRHEEEIGAHATGWNTPSLGLCLVGTDQFTELQWLQLKATLTGLAKRYEVPLVAPGLLVQDKKGIVRMPGVCGHRDLPGVAKSCPGFSVADWLAGGLAPLAGHVAAE